MKSLLLALTCFICIAKTFGQSNVRKIVVEFTKEDSPKKIYAKVELKTVPFPADSGLLQSIEKSINGSVQALIRRVEAGKYFVSASFIVDNQGNPSEISCENDPGFGLKEEVIRALKKGTWKLGEIKHHVGQVEIAITKEKKPKNVHAKVEIKVPFAGGDSAWVQRLEKSLNQTVIKVRNRKIKAGKYIVTVSFILDKEGRVSEVGCENDPGFWVKEDVIRAIRALDNNAWRGGVIRQHH